MKKRWWHGLLIGLVSALLAVAFEQRGWLANIEFASWAARARLWMRPSPVSDAIRIIFIDQASLDWAAQNFQMGWPWMREAYSPIIDFCRRGGAKAIVLDLLFTEPSTYGLGDDEALGKALAALPDNVVAVFTGTQAGQTDVWPEDVPPPRWQIEGLEQWLDEARRAVLADPNASFPVTDIRKGAATLAAVRVEPDPDGVIRRIAPFRLFDGKVLPTLGLAAYLVGAAKENPPHCRVTDDRLYVGRSILPLDRKGRAILRFRGPTGTYRAFSAAGIIQSEYAIRDGLRPSIDPYEFEGKYVFLGASAPGLKDLKPTPVDGDFPGVELHATLLDNLLDGDAIQDPHPFAVYAALIALCLLAGLAIIRANTIWKTSAALAIFLLIPVAASAVAYRCGWWWPFAVHETGVAAALVIGLVVNYATEGRQKRFIKSAFKHYLGETVIDQILADPSKLKLGGERRELTMFFSDLEKFSTFSEKLEPTQLIDLLNEYLSAMGEVLMEEGGYVDKFIGDAIVAFWNAPATQPDHAVRAIRAALKCQRILAERQAFFSAKAAGMPVRMRIGLNTGDVVVGNMGSRERFNYTMLGDAANLASRLEGANKAFGTFILASESTWRSAAGAAFGRYIGAIRVVGRQQPVRVYEPMAFKPAELPGWIVDFEKAVAAVEAKDWQTALKIFEKLKDDRPSQVYARKLKELKGADWDGIWNLTEK